MEKEKTKEQLEFEKNFTKKRPPILEKLPSKNKKEMEEEEKSKKGKK